MFCFEIFLKVQRWPATVPTHKRTHMTVYYGFFSGRCVLPQRRATNSSFPTMESTDKSYDCLGHKGGAIEPETCEVPGCWPAVLEEWSTAALRTQPADLLRWSAVYFNMKSGGERPPARPYLDERRTERGPGGLTPNTLKALAATLRRDGPDTHERVETVWDVLSLDRAVLSAVMRVGRFHGQSVDRLQLVGIAAAHLAGRLRDTMALLCDALAVDDGGPAGVPLHEFVATYQYLAGLNCADAALSPSYWDRRPSETDADIGRPGPADSEDPDCFSCSDGTTCDDSMDSDYDDDDDDGGLSGDLAKTDQGSFGKRSADGLMPWQHDDSGSSTVAKPPTNAAICDGPEYALSLQRLKDGVRLISDSTVISECCPSAVSLVSPSLDYSSDAPPYGDDGAVPATVAEEFGDDDDDDWPPTELFDYHNRNGTDGYSYEDAVTAVDYDKIFAKVDGTGKREESDVEYGDGGGSEHGTEVETDVSSGGHVPNHVSANKDFVVMLALVTGDPSLRPTAETDDPETDVGHEESETEFSLLDKTVLDGDTDERIVDETTENDGQTAFVDDYNIYDGDRSTDTDGGGNSSGSDEFRNAEQNAVVHSRSTMSVSGSGWTDLLPEIANEETNWCEDGAETTVDNESCRRFGCTDGAVDVESRYTDDDDDGCDETGESNVPRIFFDPAAAASKPLTYDVPAAGTSMDRDEELVDVLPGVGPVVPNDQIQRVVEWVTKCADGQDGFVRAHNLVHFLCPPLDLRPDDRGLEFWPSCTTTENPA